MILRSIKALATSLVVAGLATSGLASAQEASVDAAESTRCLDVVHAVLDC